MNRGLVLKLSLLGPVMGALVVFGVFPQGVDRFAWMVVNIGCAVVIARSSVDNVFRHGAVIGFVVGASATLVQGVFADALIANNPWVMDKFADQPEGFDMQLFIMQLVPFIGIAGALLTGFLSFLAGRVLRREGTA
jgi:hypothetical protein